ncbi:hypothetical protein GYB59_16955 [bacterium]|nr:hypothetical protein [bacterium]
MSWDRKPQTGRRYYYRNKRIDGRSVKEYVGRGPKADKAALRDEEVRLQQQRDHHYWDARIVQIERSGESLTQLVTLAKLLTRSVLIANGFYLHKGHEWRRRKTHA